MAGIALKGQCDLVSIMVPPEVPLKEKFPFLSWFRKLAIKRHAVAVLINKDRFCNTIVTVTKFKAISDCRQRKFLQPVNLTNTAAKVAWKSVGQIFTFC